ncbi:MAG: M1 family metallopeptidase [Clostridiales bacterium]|jgi:hypothetical protein|nr:M1 family metallopeptidase [Clostridiales bacterium]
MKKKEKNKKILLILILIFTVFATGAIAVFAIDGGRTKYDLTLRLDSEAMTLYATETVTYVNQTGDTLKELRFNLYPNAFRENAKIKPYYESGIADAYPAGIDYGFIEIESVKTGGRDAGFEIGGEDKNILIAVFGSPLLNKRAEGIEIVFSVKIPQTNLRFGYYDGIVNLTNFFPIACVYADGGFVECPYLPLGDPFLSEDADYKVDLKTDKPYVAAHSGNLASEKSDEGGRGKLFKFEGKRIRDFALCLSEKFGIETKKNKGKTVKYYYIKGNAGEYNAEKKAALALSALTFFGEYFIAYPYKTFCAVETYLTAGGMEYPNLVLINQGLREEDKESVIVHETAHQWWYGIVGNDNLNYAWTDEGLTEFSTELYFGKNGRVLKAAQYYQYNYTAAKRFDEIAEGIGIKNATMEKPLKEYLSEYEYVIGVYSRGHLLFHDLYRTVGEKNFQKALRHYAKKNKYRIASKGGLVGAFEKYDGGAGRVFDEWISFQKVF